MPKAGCSWWVPARPEAELYAPAAHRVDCGHHDREWPGNRNVTGLTSVPSRMREVSRPSPASVIQASDEPARPPHDAEVVVGAKEPSKAKGFGRLGDPEQIVVGRAFLGLAEDMQLHSAHLRCCARTHLTIGMQIPSPGQQRPATKPLRRCVRRPGAARSGSGPVVAGHRLGVLEHQRGQAAGGDHLHRAGSAGAEHGASRRTRPST